MMKSRLKTIHFAFYFLLVTTTFSWADFGFKAGINLASQRQGGYTSQGAKAGVLAGFFIPMPINRVFTLQPELYFIQKGSKKAPSEASTDYVVTTKLNNLDIILLSKFHLLPNNKLRPFLLFGPYVSVLISGEYSVEGQKQDTDDLHRLEYGYSAGGGLEFPIGKSRISLDIRFSHSLTDIHNVPSRMWNRGISFSAGYYF